MPKTKLQDFIFTVIMALIMVYGMIVYNVAPHTGGLCWDSFLFAFKELPIMVPIAIILEFFIVSKLAKKLAFKIVKPEHGPGLITIAISSCICMIMCPIMSFIATLLFNKDITFATFIPIFIKTWARNFPMALLYQIFYCGPIVRLIFKLIFSKKNKGSKEI